MSLYLADGINADAVYGYLKECAANGINVRTLQVIKGNEPLIQIAMNPYDLDAPMHLYSLSKTFTSMAVGMCVDDGKLSVRDKLCDIFPDKMPQNMTDELKKMTIHDLLSMQSGHETCFLHNMRWAEDSVKAFFEQPFKYEPGTTFVYSTAATCICAAAVERVTGKKLVDFLDERLFSKLGIKKPVWRECRDGQTLGGTGLEVSNNDVAKLGIMLKNKGIYNGERIVSEEYIKTASSFHADNSCNGTPDWVVGYGYQIWLNERDGFRGDGAFGQLCVVLPKDDVVVVLLGEAGNMQTELSLVYKLVDTMFGENGDKLALAEYVDKAYITKRNENGFNRELAFEVAENPCDLNKVRLFGENLLHVELETSYGKKEFVCGNGEYLLNHVMLKNLSPTIVTLDPNVDTVERVSVFASYEILDDGKIQITLRHHNTCHVQRWIIDPDNNCFDIKVFVGYMVCTHFELGKIELDIQ
ncbi:MAG: beta-lactamase family protein [Clostridia bacterium]|nr:beta-lactamase family protein [Clostridia bacterium]